jgi:F0F1-type ATP synthase membrane subunit a
MFIFTVMCYCTVVLMNFLPLMIQIMHCCVPEVLAAWPPPFQAFLKIIWQRHNLDLALGVQAFQSSFEIGIREEGVKQMDQRFPLSDCLCDAYRFFAVVDG